MTAIRSTAVGLNAEGPEARRLSEGEIVEASRAGHLESYAALVRRYERRVLGLARRLLGDEHEAEDAAQEAFLRAWRALKTFRAGEDFGRWLLKIAANAALDMARRKRPRPAPAEVLGGASATCPAPPAAAEHEETRRLRSEALESALAALPERQRQAFVLFHTAGMSYSEIAARLGAPVGTVRSSLHRARTALRSALAERMETADELR
jgi:RNA polymerase sigma-70 factor (ECF subfamily)